MISNPLLYCQLNFRNYQRGHYRCITGWEEFEKMLWRQLELYWKIQDILLAFRNRPFFNQNIIRARWIEAENWPTFELENTNWIGWATTWNRSADVLWWGVDSPMRKPNAYKQDTWDELRTVPTWSCPLTQKNDDKKVVWPNKNNSNFSIF